ncbi:hypothetical protein F2Q69_00002727 [Brassica cretica]|uniref:Uncharacterized protein n=1 Tax=Brassica cretica TaxID=69181 RepID=A0A8S9PFA3_BRACR|nr:hypothetical protein F2Q69_00002727 [Brassica cretica]
MEPVSSFLKSVSSALVSLRSFNLKLSGWVLEFVFGLVSVTVQALRSPSPGLLIRAFPGWSYVSLVPRWLRSLKQYREVEALWSWLGTVNWRFRYVAFCFVVLVTASLTLSCVCVVFGKSSGCFNH